MTMRFILVCKTSRLVSDCDAYKNSLTKTFEVLDIDRLSYPKIEVMRFLQLTFIKVVSRPHEASDFSLQN